MSDVTKQVAVTGKVDMIRVAFGQGHPTVKAVKAYLASQGVTPETGGPSDATVETQVRKLRKLAGLATGSGSGKLTHKDAVAQFKATMAAKQPKAKA